MNVGVALNGISPEQLDGRLRVTGIREEPPRLRRTMVPMACGSGSRMVRLERESLSIRVKVQLPEPDAAQRAALGEKLAAWAGKGVLTLTSRPGRQLHVRCTVAPGMGELADWSSPTEITLTACEVPYWEDASPTVVLLHSQERRSALVTVPGNAGETSVSARVTCMAERLDDLTLYAGDTRIRLEGLGMSSGQVLTLQEEDGRLRISVDGTDVSACRTGDSDDRLLMTCGRIGGMSLASEAAASAELEIRGRYL